MFDVTLFALYKLLFLELEELDYEAMNDEVLKK